MIAVSRRPLPHVGPFMLVDRLQTSWNGRQRVIALDGTVMSVLPVLDGNGDPVIEWKSIDHDGQYEQSEEDDRGFLGYHSGHAGTDPYFYAFFKKVPA